MKTRVKKPPKCCYPNCFECPYKDCRYDRLEAEDFTETNNRDYFLYEDSTGNEFHQKSDSEYRNDRSIAYQRKKRRYIDRHEYNQKYYKEHAEEIKNRKRSEYDTRKNTIRCRKYRRKNIEQRKAYDKSYYEENKEEIKRKARERYYKKKGEES